MSIDRPLSPQQMSDRFDLLAGDAKEYAIFLMDLDGHLICWNIGAEQLFGYQSQEIIGRHFSRFFLPDEILTGQPEHELAARSPMGVQTAVAGRSAKMARDSGAGRS